MAVLGQNGMVTGSQTVTIRPLSVGMVTEGSSVLTKAGAMAKIAGFDVTETGLSRVGGFVPVTSIPVATLFDDNQANVLRRLHEVPKDFALLVLDNGDTRMVVITNKMLYWFEDSLFKPVWWNKKYTVTGYDGTGSDGIIRVAGNEIVDSFLDDSCWISFDGAWSIYKVKSVAYESGPGETVITIWGKPASAPTEFYVAKPLGGQHIDWCTARNAMWIVDGVTPAVMRYDGTWLKPMKVVDPDTGVQTMRGAKRIGYYRERLYWGDVQDGSEGTLRVHQRVRWSEVLGWSNTSEVIPSGAENYQDLVNGYGPIEKILGYEELLMVFATDMVYYGRQTSLTGLPYALVPMQTGNVSAVGPNAVVGLMGGVVFVGQDDVYVVSLDQGYPTFQKIASPVANSIFPLKFPKSVTVKTDPTNSRIVIGIPEESDTYFSKMWFWNWRTKGWSMEEDVKPLVISSVAFTDQLRYSEMESGWSYENSPYSTFSYDALQATPGDVGIYIIDQNYGLYKYVRDQSTHAWIGKGITPVRVEVETEDYDFDEPDIEKTWLSLGVRIQKPIEFVGDLSVSTNGGETWRPLGKLIFTENDTEDSISFRLTSSRARFRIQGYSDVAGLTILEMTIRVKLRGAEYQRNTLRIGR